MTTVVGGSAVSSGGVVGWSRARWVGEKACFACVRSPELRSRNLGDGGRMDDEGPIIVADGFE